MSFLLNLIPAPYRIAGVLIVAALAFAAGSLWLHHDRAKHERIGADAITAEWNVERAWQDAEALKQANANAAETQRRLTAQKEAQDAHDKELARARADAAGARTALDGLRARAAALATAARRAAPHPAAAALGQAAADPLGVLADVLGQLGDRAQRLAEYADAARAAGQQCQASFETLTP